MAGPATPYIKPGFFTARVFNPVVSFLAGRLGLSMKGARVLSVQGRKSGEWHSTPVNPLSFKGQRYLVAPRGETQWVRNIRVSSSSVASARMPRRPKSPASRRSTRSSASGRRVVLAARSAAGGGLGFQTGRPLGCGKGWPEGLGP